ncbi:MAG: glycosyltransferase family 9 protein [Candidatus Algichlamydia australiensis]|nr:glycosyltransferase family 9 protein [Chlamydiales bacterium]
MRSTKYLIVKLSSLGDVIQTLPFASYLDGHVTWAVESEYTPLLKSVPAIDEIRPIPFRKWRSKKCCFSELKRRLQDLGSYDVVFDLQGNCKSGLVTKFAKAKEKVGFAKPVEWPNRLVTNRKIVLPEHFSIREQLRHLYTSYFGKEPEEHPLKLVGEEIPIPKPVFMVCMDSRWRNKQLTKALWREFLAKLQKEYKVHFLFVFGEKEEPISKEFPGSVTILKPEFGTWQRLMHEVDLILTVDSASLALANTTNTPTFALFGPSSAKIFGPSAPGSGNFQGVCPYGETFVKRCSKLRTCPTGACLREATLKQLLLSFQNQCGFPQAQSPHESSPCPLSESLPCTK